MYLGFWRFGPRKPAPLQGFGENFASQVSKSDVNLRSYSPNRTCSVSSIFSTVIFGLASAEFIINASATYKACGVISVTKERCFLIFSQLLGNFTGIIAKKPAFR